MCRIRNRGELIQIIMETAGDNKLMRVKTDVRLSAFWSNVMDNDPNSVCMPGEDGTSISTSTTQLNSLRILVLWCQHHT